MRKNIYLILFSFVITFEYIKTNEYSTKNKKSNTFCEVDKIKSNVLTYNISEEEKKINKNRRLETNDDVNYGPINIFISTTVLDVQLDASFAKPLIKESLIEVKNYISKLIYVKHLNYTIKIDEQLLRDNNLVLPSSGTHDQSLVQQGISCDLVIVPVVQNLNLATSKNILKDNYTNRIILAGLYISNSFYNKEGNIQKFYLKSILLHQFFHILGFHYDSFQYFPGGLENTIKKQADSRGINRTYIITPKVMELAKKYYNCDYIIGLELEDQDENENPGSHWESRILLGEIMNSEQYNPEIVLSEFTLALLEDSSWYKVNYYTGGLMRFGKNKGCDFLDNDCCNNKGITQFKNEFFDLEDNDKSSCSSGRLSRTYNNKKAYTQSDIEYYRILENNQNIGGLTKNADYCFGFSDLQEDSNNLFVGNCKLGNGNYGSKILYKDNNYYTNSQNQNLLSEKYSNNSFCVLSEAYPKGSTTEENNSYKNKFDSIVHPLCYEMFCSNHSLTIKIKDQYVVCPRKGGKVEINGDFQGYLYCPDYNLICTGTYMCNDLFDCIDKNSTSRNLIYDYDFNGESSSQKISAIQNENIIKGYEINENEGFCPIYCSQCKQNKRCFQCIEGFIKLGKKENDNEPIICDNNTDISTGYFIKDDVYYPCIEYCVQCDSSYTCIKCNNIHKTNEDNSKCIDKVENCEIYTDTDFTCSKCKGEYVLIGDDRDNCYIINDKSKYYTFDNKVYYPCNTSIANCEICNNNKDICSKCEENYYLINDNKTFCFNDKNLTKYYTPDNKITYILCNNSIPFCDSCYNNTICRQCGQNHYFLKDNRTHCIIGLNLDLYYTEDNDVSYYPCNEAIINCFECDAKDVCNKCEKDYYFIGDNRVECKNDFDKNKYYTEDNIVYYPCDTNFPYCEECTNKYTCTKCINEYGFLGYDRSKCYFVNNNEYYTEDGISYYPCYSNLLNCENCLNKTYCSKCNQTFHFIGFDRTRCFSISDYTEYYTEDGGFSYFPCNTEISYCKNCNSKNDCTKCQTNYYFIGNDRNSCVNDRNLNEYYSLDDGKSYFPCYEPLENCKNCEVPTTCIDCQENTYFLRDDTTKCLSLNLKEYYTEDGKRYYPCSESMEHCLECYNKNFCSRCITDYYLKYEIPNVCFEFATFQNDKTYYKLNETHYKKCSSSMNNCIYCDIGTECLLCEDDHYYINDDKSKCVHISQIVPEDEYYKIDDYNYYSCGYEKIVENCKKCENSYSCLLCKDGYAFQNDLFNKCYSKESMKIGFYHNDEETMYYPCFENCDYCINGNECQQCSINNELLFDKTICGECQLDFINIKNDLNLETIHSLVKKYLEETKNNLTYIPYYINEDKNYSIVIFHSWECTKYLFSLGYFSLNTDKLHRIIIEKNGQSLTSLTYVFVNYDNYQNYIEIYNSDNNLINLKQMCPECLNTEYIIQNNLTDIILNSFGKEIVKNIVLNNVNTFNESDPVFSDFCSNFTIQNFEIPLKERRKMLFLGNNANELICLDSSCEIANVTMSEYTGNCKCKIQSELSLILQNRTNKQITFDNKGNNNFPVFACYNKGFNKTIIKSNVGFFIGIAFIAIQILAFVLYILYSQPSKNLKNQANPPISTSTVKSNDNSEMLFLDNFDEIMKENGKKIMNDNENPEMDYQDRDDLDEDLISQQEYDEELENKKTIDYLLSTDGPITHAGKRYNSKLKDFNKEKNLGLDTYSVKLHSNKKDRNEKLLFKDSSENESSIKYKRNKKREPYNKNSAEINSKTSFESNDDLNIKGIQKKNFTSRIYKSLNDAKRYDKTSFCEYYCIILGLRQSIINLFLTNKCIYLGEDYVPFNIKIIRFIFILSLTIFMNTLHLNHKYYYKKFEYFDKKYDLRNIELGKNISSSEIFSYAFKNSFVMGFISFIFCYLVQEILNRYVINNRVEIDTLINATIGKVKDVIIKEILRKKRKKYIILVIIDFVFMIGFYFYITNFYGVYYGGYIDYLAATVITFIFMQFFPFLLCFIFTLFRYYGIKNSNSTLYKLGQLLIY